MGGGIHGFHMDSIWINPGSVKTSLCGPLMSLGGKRYCNTVQLNVGQYLIYNYSFAGHYSQNGEFLVRFLANSR